MGHCGERRVTVTPGAEKLTRDDADVSLLV